MLVYNHDLLAKAKELRKNMTFEERKLWYQFLRKHPEKFVRQKVIGNYIVDFYAPNKLLAIELDGSQHFEAKGVEYDRARTQFLNKLGIMVLRYANNEVKENFRGVCESIEQELSLRANVG